MDVLNQQQHAKNYAEHKNYFFPTQFVHQKNRGHMTRKKEVGGQVLSRIKTIMHQWIHQIHTIGRRRQWNQCQTQHSQSLHDGVSPHRE